MRRIWFKEEMKAAILAGKKTATTRDHQKALGEWEAVTGSWYHPVAFAVIEITSNVETQWGNSLANWKAEGFDSLADMLNFADRTGLNKYGKAPKLYNHEFTVKERLA